MSQRNGNSQPTELLIPVTFQPRSHDAIALCNLTESIHIFENKLTGTLPSEIGLLQNLGKSMKWRGLACVFVLDQVEWLLSMDDSLNATDCAMTACPTSSVRSVFEPDRQCIGRRVTT